MKIVKILGIFSSLVLVFGVMVSVRAKLQGASGEELSVSTRKKKQNCELVFFHGDYRRVQESCLEGVRSDEEIYYGVLALLRMANFQTAKKYIAMLESSPDEKFQQKVAFARDLVEVLQAYPEQANFFVGVKDDQESVTRTH